MRTLILWGLMTVFITIVHPIPVFAKVLPRFARQPAKATTGGGSGVYVKPALRQDRRALNVYFSNLTKAKAVSYMLIYQSAGIDKGAGGSIDMTGADAINRELLFGTESSGVYHYDESLTNMRLEITTELVNGKKTLKRFRIRI